MAPSHPAPARKRILRLTIPLVLILVCTTCLWFSLCGSFDIADDPATNGGYNRNAIFFLQTPIAVNNRQFAHPLPLPITDPADVEIPAGCRLQITRVRLLRWVMADNLPRMSVEARCLDGPLAGATVDITYISARTASRRVQLDPTYLQPTPPKSAPGSIPPATARELLNSLPETEAFRKTLDSPYRSIVIVQESPAGDHLQFALSEDRGDHLKLWNRFRIAPNGEITVWLPEDDSWLDLPTWRQRTTH